MFIYTYVAHICVTTITEEKQVRLGPQNETVGEIGEVGGGRQGMEMM